MSNGDQCCALEICCYWKKDKTTLAAKISEKIGVPIEDCLKFLDWMAHNDLVFAPESFDDVLDDIIRITRAHPL